MKHERTFAAEQRDARDWVYHPVDWTPFAPGTRCPLPYSTVVQVLFRSGLESGPTYAGFWGAHGVTSAWDRKHRDPILAWRPAEFKRRADAVDQAWRERA